MDSNTHSTPASTAGRLTELVAVLEAVLDGLATQDTGGMADAVRAEQVLRLMLLFRVN